MLWAGGDGGGNEEIDGDRDALHVGGCACKVDEVKRCVCVYPHDAYGICASGGVGRGGGGAGKQENVVLQEEEEEKWEGGGAGGHLRRARESWRGRGGRGGRGVPH